MHSRRGLDHNRNRSEHTLRELSQYCEMKQVSCQKLQPVVETSVTDRFLPLEYSPWYLRSFAEFVEQLSSLLRVLPLSPMNGSVWLVLQNRLLLVLSAVKPSVSSALYTSLRAASCEASDNRYRLCNAIFWRHLLLER